MINIKKILLLITLFLSFFIVWNIWVSATDCSLEDVDDFNVWKFLDDCKPSKVVWNSTWTGYEIDRDSSFWGMIAWWIQNISFILWIFAVWAIVYSWFLLQISFWEDEKIKKAKDIFKWSLIWFIGLISINAIIYLVITIIYELA